MASVLISALGQPRADALAFLVSFGLSFFLVGVLMPHLPHDHGREFAVNGELSRGKPRGAGLVFVPCIALISLAFLPFSVEFLIYMLLLIGSMLSGFFDDASDISWNEYKKGLIDLVLAVLMGVTYLNFNPPELILLGTSLTLPRPVYLVLAIILTWGSINVTNCADGVDGLSSSVAIVTMGTFALLFGQELGSIRTAALVYIASLLAYLWRNVSPSQLMMGDAGSRAMGFFIALLAMKSGHPVAYLVAGLVFILDGGLGIVKISLKRFLHIAVLKHTLTPLHDHVRRRFGWSDPQVVLRFAAIQALLSAGLWLLIAGA